MTNTQTRAHTLKCTMRQRRFCEGHGESMRRPTKSVTATTSVTKTRLNRRNTATTRRQGEKLLVVLLKPGYLSLAWCQKHLALNVGQTLHIEQGEVVDRLELLI